MRGRGGMGRGGHGARQPFHAAAYGRPGLLRGPRSGSASEPYSGGITFKGASPYDFSGGVVFGEGSASSDLEAILTSWRATWGQVKGHAAKMIDGARSWIPWVQKNPAEAQRKASDGMAKLDETCRMLAAEYARLTKLGAFWASTPKGQAAWKSYAGRAKTYQILAAGVMSQVDRVVDNQGRTVARGLCSVRTTPAFGWIPLLIPIAGGAIKFLITWGGTAWIISEIAKITGLWSESKKVAAEAQKAEASVAQARVDIYKTPAGQAALQADPAAASSAITAPSTSRGGGLDLNLDWGKYVLPAALVIGGAVLATTLARR